MVCDESDAMSNINSIQNRGIMAFAVMSVIIIIIGYVLSLKITKPIEIMTGAVKDISMLNFSDSQKLTKVEKRSDETGEMARQIFVMEETLKQVVKDIKAVSDKMADNAANLVNVTENINQASSDNSATSEELAASMEETSATAITIDSNMNQILDNTDVIDKESRAGVTMANEINDRAVDMNKDAVESNEKTTQIVTLSDDVMKVVNDTNDDSNKLSGIADKFTI